MLSCKNIITFSNVNFKIATYFCNFITKHSDELG